MRISNTTAYDTGKIRAILRGVLHEFTRIEGHGRYNQLKKLHVWITSAKQRRGVSGCAQLHGSRVTLRIPLPTPGKDDHYPYSLARVFAHELYHCMGRNHGEFSEKSCEDFGKPYLSWTRFPVKAEEPAPKSTISLKHRNYLKARHRLEVAKKDYKLAANRVKIWEAKVSKYEKALAKIDDIIPIG